MLGGSNSRRPSLVRTISHRSRNSPRCRLVFGLLFPYDAASATHIRVALSRDFRPLDFVPTIRHMSVPGSCDGISLVNGVTGAGAYVADSATSFFRLLRIHLTVVFMFVVAVSSANAVPVFARKYRNQLSDLSHCFSETQRLWRSVSSLRGYRLPGETQEAIKEKPVSLGAPAYKPLWPDAVWPGDLPSNVPLAVNITLTDVNSSTLNEDGSVTSIKNDLRLPEELNLFGAGTLGEHLSIFSEVTFGEQPDGSASVELEHANLGIDSPFGPEDLFHFRIGSLRRMSSTVFRRCGCRPMPVSIRSLTSTRSAFEEALDSVQTP